MIYIGIDPGKLGGIAAVFPDGKFAFSTKMPDTEQEILGVLGFLLKNGKAGRAVLEFIRSSPQMGVSSAFTFGCGYGGLRMALVACGIPFDQAVPSKWQQVMSCRTGGDKNVTKRRAQELFPAVKITHAVADAILIAEYCRRKQP